MGIAVFDYVVSTGFHLDTTVATSIYIQVFNQTIASIIDKAVLTCITDDEPLDMRLNNSTGLSAADIVNGYSEESLADVIYKYGEERYSRRIARAIAEKREEGAIETSSQLADIIKASVPKEYRYGRIHPATRTFQALRIEVNKELDRITPALENAIRVLKKGGRIAVITFHSLEDRKVKWFFKDEAGKENPRIRILTKKPIIPSEEEEKENPPSRSAKLRVVERI